MNNPLVHCQRGVVVLHTIPLLVADMTTPLLLWLLSSLIIFHVFLFSASHICVLLIYLIHWLDSLVIIVIDDFLACFGLGPTMIESLDGDWPLENAKVQKGGQAVIFFLPWREVYLNYAQHAMFGSMLLRADVSSAEIGWQSSGRITISYW